MRRRRLTNRQVEVFDFIADFYERNDEIPPMWAIAKHFGWASLNSAQCHVDALARLKLLERNEIGNWRFARRLTEAT